MCQNPQQSPTLQEKTHHKVSKTFKLVDQSLMDISNQTAQNRTKQNKKFEHCSNKSKKKDHIFT